MNIRQGLLIGGVILLLGATAWAGSGTSGFILVDPQGDDHGDGTLSYPARPDMQPGDLDLLELKAEPSDDGTWFMATFARNIRPPGPEPVDAVGTTMEGVAKLGFYTFNIDIYIDTDRIAGSGKLSTLPGRKATIDPATAWEKVICLTPRPDEASVLLKRELTTIAKGDARKNKPHVDDEDLALAREFARGSLESQFFFPKRVQVNGRKIRFFVPNSFLSGPARPEWAYTVAVTGAEVVGKLDTTRLLGKQDEEGPGLLVIPVGTGISKDHFAGREDDELQPPLVDIIVPAGARQEDVLKDYDLRIGRKVKLMGVVPTPKK